MVKKVGIIGIGYYGFRSVTPELSFREMIYEAATRAYRDAGLRPKDIDGFVTAGEDWSEGHSIADEITPDQLGAVKRPVFTVNGDFMHALISAVMHILTAQMNICLVESCSKASNVKTMPEVTAMAMDPIFNRPLGENPYFIAGLEMNRYLYETGTTREQCAQVVAKNKGNGLLNPYAGHGVSLSKDEVLESDMISYPLTTLDISPHSDGAVVAILASEDRAITICKDPIWIEGMGWCSDSPSLERRPWGEAVYTQIAAEMAYKMARIDYPRKEIDLAEVSDEFSYKELQHLGALRLCKKGEAGFLVEEGALGISGELPVNPSGGCLGVGSLLEATGAQKILELVLQLRGEAGQRQVPHAEVGLAQTWRGIPTTSGAVLILSNR
ncbi:MAG: acetyl-CoA acetyltransferase [Deltaproteobacteria bacterium]|nr:acetyl-CoA acetyltransferase [Deltaproteobacteria bacterium]